MRAISIVSNRAITTITIKVIIVVVVMVTVAESSKRRYRDCKSVEHTTTVQCRVADFTIQNSSEVSVLLLADGSFFGCCPYYGVSYDDVGRACDCHCECSCFCYRSLLTLVLSVDSFCLQYGCEHWYIWHHCQYS